jgi:hypothetical protein
LAARCSTATMSSNTGPSSAAERAELRQTISIGSPLYSVIASHSASGLLPK